MALLRTPQALLCGLLLGLVACGRQEPPEPSPPPERIIAVSPSITETLFVLGLGEKVVGVGDFSHWPPEAESKPRIGGLFDARIEQIVALDPDLAVLLPSEEDLRERLQSLGVEVLTVPSETLADVEASIRAIGERAGVETAAAAFLADWRRSLAAERLAGRPRVLLSLAREPGRLGQILTAGPDTFLDELLARLGAENVFADAPIRYPQVSAEEVLERRPRVIVELLPDEASAAVHQRLVADWLDTLGLGEVAGTCVRVLEGDHLLLPGPRLPRVYSELREAIAGCAGEGGAEPAAG